MVLKICIVSVNNAVTGATMPKFYIKCGSLELIKSCPGMKSIHAAQISLWETNKFDTLDEYFYIDQRGFRDYITADKKTKVYSLEKVAKLAGWRLE